MKKLVQDIDPNKIPEVILGRPPVEYRMTDVSLLKEFRTAMNRAEEARSESPLQSFLEKHPVALLSVVRPHRCWVFPKLALSEAFGGGWEPDFLICDWTSLGPEWTIIEIESPTQRVMSKRGPSRALEIAMQQIRDYRGALIRNTQNYQAAGLNQGHRQKRSWIIIGRRPAVTTEEEQRRLADLRGLDIEVASWDRLLDSCAEMVKYRVGERQRFDQAKQRKKDEEGR